MLEACLSCVGTCFTRFLALMPETLLVQSNFFFLSVVAAWVQLFAGIFGHGDGNIMAFEDGKVYTDIH